MFNVHISQTGSACHRETHSCEYPMLVWDRKPAREKGELWETPFVTFRKRLPGVWGPSNERRWMLQNVILCVVWGNAPVLAKTRVSQSDAPDFWCRNLQKSYALWKFKRESRMRSGRHKLSVATTARQPLSLVSFWNVTKSDSHGTGEGCSLNTALDGSPTRHALHPNQFTTTDRLSTKADAENPVAVCF